MNDIKVLIACEESQTICKAFRERWFEAYSNDLQNPSGGHPECHIKDDALRLINGCCMFLTMDNTIHFIEKWDLIIAHPPCTYLSNAGASSLFKVVDGKSWVDYERFMKGIEGKHFFLKFFKAHCEQIAIENPTPSHIYDLPDYTQSIQPWFFGDPYNKRTLLWLKNLPKLKPTKIIKPLFNWVNSSSSKKSKLPVIASSAKMRSKSFQGIADAMAKQWGDYLLASKNAKEEEK